ncbi:flagellar biosynthesis protein FliQ [Chitinispirillales bacterium ANBcel5]|uniref:flagellar biosynthesis protein FliQ n=1 Tax=Cellulosispirillum alkaliphilum TaxID=3039283 RepID=UPI002A4E8CE3|nr:flagellar biosynthesis protein FliQ [Chitinispirillales bacterium ANBcel5]
MEPSVVVDIGRHALWITLLISGPLLLVGLFIGLCVGIFQAVTQIHEMTLTFIPKILGIVTVLILLMPWMILKLIEYTYSLFDLIGRVGR